jgi:hypothetical protein
MESEKNFNITTIQNKEIIYINNFLEKIYSISSKLNESQELILNKIEYIELRLSKIEYNIENIIVKNNSSDNVIELKIENIELDKKIIMKALQYRDYKSVICIFREYYKNNKTNNYPIKVVGKRTYEFYLNNKWNSDTYGHYIMNTICRNVQNILLKGNVIETMQENGFDYNDFLLNQSFIYKLGDEKYKKEILKNIIEEVRLNNSEI